MVLYAVSGGGLIPMTKQRKIYQYLTTNRRQNRPRQTLVALQRKF
jgi:hypothetical protein